MNRMITTHIVDGDSVQNQVSVTVVDEPGAGGANHAYAVSWKDQDGVIQESMIAFQNGPIKENGVNGLTHEALLAILIDRLHSFQNGPFPCPENQSALNNLTDALEWLQRRTRDRIARNVEGQTAR